MRYGPGRAVSTGAAVTITSGDWFSNAERLRGLFGALIGATTEGVAPAFYTWRVTARRTGAEMVTVRPTPGQAWTEAVLDVPDGRVGAAGLRRRSGLADPRSLSCAPSWPRHPRWGGDAPGRHPRPQAEPTPAVRDE
jgi:hypothetical protein